MSQVQPGKGLSESRLSVLKALLQTAPGAHLSGEELSHRLGLSRVAVWKHIRELKALGCAIEALPRRGYRLQQPDQVLLPETVGRCRNGRKLGEPLEVHPALPSTNDRAKTLAAAGAPEGTAVLAWSQTRGRGRLGREWASPPGGLWLSVVLRPPLSPAEVPRLTLVCAVAVAEAVAAVSGLRPGIKWPNDLLLGGRKVCGILTELTAESERVAYAVVGIGLNANLTPEQLPPGAATPTTSLLQALGQPVGLPALAAGVLDRLESWYARFLTEGFGPVRSRWLELSATIGQFVTATQPGGVIAGIAVDLAEDGALVLRLADGGLRPVLAGDVTLRPQASGQNRPS